MYSSYPFSADRQPSRASAADATGDTTRAAMGMSSRASRAWTEPAATSQTERRDIAVAQADGEP